MKLISTMFTYAASICTQLLAAKILLSIAIMASLPFIPTLTFAQVFIMLACIRLATYNISITDLLNLEKVEEKWGVFYGVVIQIGVAVAMLISWVITVLVYHLIA